MAKTDGTPPIDQKKHNDPKPKNKWYPSDELTIGALIAIAQDKGEDWLDEQENDRWVIKEHDLILEEMWKELKEQILADHSGEERDDKHFQKQQRREEKLQKPEERRRVLNQISNEGQMQTRASKKLLEVNILKSMANSQRPIRTPPLILIHPPGQYKKIMMTQSQRTLNHTIPRTKGEIGQV